MKDLKVLGAYDLERPLWVVSGLSRPASFDPLQPFEVSTRPRTIHLPTQTSRA